MADGQTRQLHFGPFSVLGRRIFRARRPLKMQSLVFRFLELLLEHPGEVVTRQQCCERLWPGSWSTIDLRSGLDTIAKKLRKVLDDSPDEPIYFETIPGRGYRFIASVRELSATETDGPSHGPGHQRSSEAVSSGDPEGNEQPLPASEVPSLSPSVEPSYHGGTGPVSAVPARIESLFAGLWGHRSAASVPLWIAVVCLIGVVVGLTRSRPAGTWPPADWQVAGRLLTILDARKGEKWSFQFEHTSLLKEVGSPYPRILFSDLDGMGKTEVLFVHEPVDERQLRIPDGGAEIYCFSEDGALLWRRKFGTSFTTPSGRVYPESLYHIRVLGILKKPRPDGGVIVAGGHRGGSWTFQVAIYTAKGEKVAEYLHPGWIFDMVIVDLNEDGTEEIILGGVNNGYSEVGYGATIVVLDSRNMGHKWQGSVPEEDDRRALGWVPGKEEAVVLIKEFAPDPNMHRYCRVERFMYGGGTLEAFVSKDDPKLPHVYFYFDRKLKLTAVQPELNYASQLAARLPVFASPSQRNRFVFQELGKVNYLRNALSSDGTEPDRTHAKSAVRTPR